MDKSQAGVRSREPCAGVRGNTFQVFFLPGEFSRSCLPFVSFWFSRCCPSSGTPGQWGKVVLAHHVLIERHDDPSEGFENLPWVTQSALLSSSAAAAASSGNAVKIAGLLCVSVARTPYRGQVAFGKDRRPPLAKQAHYRKSSGTATSAAAAVLSVGRSVGKAVPLVGRLVT